MAIWGKLLILLFVNFTNYKMKKKYIINFLNYICFSFKYDNISLREFTKIIIYINKWCAQRRGVREVHQNIWTKIEVSLGKEWALEDCISNNKRIFFVTALICLDGKCTFTMEKIAFLQVKNIYFWTLLVWTTTKQVLKKCLM